MTSEDKGCRKLAHDEGGKLISYVAPHSWVTSYTGNTRRCRRCSRLERLNADTTATQEKTA